MNLCTLYNTTECVRENRTPKQPRRPGVSTCAKCSAFTDSGSPRVPLTIAATVKVQPVPRDKWPLWAAAISKLATDADKGVGSTVDRLLGVGGKAYKATMRAMGVPCGCAKRKAEWDVMYRY